MGAEVGQPFAPTLGTILGRRLGASSDRRAIFPVATAGDVLPGRAARQIIGHVSEIGESANGEQQG